MPRIDVPFVVENQSITQPTGDKLVSGGQNYFYATFEIKGVWEKISNIKAVFVRDAISILVDLVETDKGYECRIPWEVMGYKGAFQVGVFGGDRMLTDYTYVIVKQGCVVEGEVPAPPTPDWFSNMENRMEEIESSGGSGTGEGGGTELTPEQLENIENVPNKVDKVSGYGLSKLFVTDGVISQNVVMEDGSVTNASSYTTNVVDRKINDVSSKADLIDEQTKLIESDVLGLQKQMHEEAHFRGYVSTNAKIQELRATPNDFVYSAESGTVWVYDEVNTWVDTGTPVPDKATPLSDATPLINGEASSGISEEGARSDHRHPTDTTRASVTQLNEAVENMRGYVNTAIGEALEGDY